MCLLESKPKEVSMSQPIPISKSDQRSSQAKDGGSSSSIEEATSPSPSPSQSNRSRSISQSSQPSSAWFDSQNHRTHLASRNSNQSSNASFKRRSLIINPLWFEADQAKVAKQRENSRSALPQIDWKQRFPDLDISSE